ncbi:MAG: hypothetical protein K2X90_03160, partial [Candidatus Babeliaceae bacterium]|nr:hypothetical protein [Candidatus Babeliaceae bacterium]
LGSGLLRYALSLAKKNGADHAFLSAIPFDREPTQSLPEALKLLENFYKKNGGIVTEYYDDSTDFHFNLDNY